MWPLGACAAGCRSGACGGAARAGVSRAGGGRRAGGGEPVVGPRAAPPRGALLRPRCAGQGSGQRAPRAPPRVPQSRQRAPTCAPLCCGALVTAACGARPAGGRRRAGRAAHPAGSTPPPSRRMGLLCGRGRAGARVLQLPRKIAEFRPRGASRHPRPAHQSGAGRLWRLNSNAARPEPRPRRASAPAHSSVRALAWKVCQGGAWRRARAAAAFNPESDGNLACGFAVTRRGLLTRRAAIGGLPPRGPAAACDPSLGAVLERGNQVLRRPHAGCARAKPSAKRAAGGVGIRVARHLLGW
jgi:hypothetical protein